MKAEWTSGAHHLKFVQPDIFLLEVGGPALLDEVKEVVRIMEEEVYPEVGDFFFFIKLDDSGLGVTADVRRYFASINPHWKAFVIIGGTTMMRATMAVAARALKLLRASRYEMRMTKTLEEAYAFAGAVRAAAKAKTATA